MYKNIIPGLVSFETELDQIRGFEMCQNFNFFAKVQRKNKFHYKIVFTGDIEVPSDYDFRSEYFIQKEKNWYYVRKIFFWHPVLRYDFENKTFYFNRSFAFLPFKLGGISTVGEYIYTVIELDLFLSDIIILRGIALQINNKNIGITAPGFNGKTTWLKEKLNQGAKYIAEDFLILNLKENKVYPTCPLLEEIFWQRRKISKKFRELLKGNSFLKNPMSLDKLYLVQNSLNLDYRAEEKKFIDFVFLNSLYFFNNLSIRSSIFDQHLIAEVLCKMEELKNPKMNYEFVGIKNFNFNFL